MSVRVTRWAWALVAAAGLAAPAWLGGPGWAARAQEEVEFDEAPTLTVSGTGTAELPADTVTVALAVVTRGATPEEALNANTRAAQQVEGRLKAMGLEDGAVTSGSFSISPVWERAPRGEEMVVTGHEVRRVVQVKTRQLAAAGRVIQTGVEAGATEVQGVWFSLTPGRGRAEAIAEAVRLAREDAGSAASASGVRLGAVRRVVVDGATARPLLLGREMAMRAMSDGGAGPEFSPGPVTVTATVTVEWGIEQNQ